MKLFFFIVLFFTAICNQEEQTIDEFGYFRTLSGEFGNITSLALSSKNIVAGSDNNKCILFDDTVYPRPVSYFQEATEEIKVVDIIESGNKFISIDAVGNLRLYDVQANNLFRTITPKTNSASAGVIQEGIIQENEHRIFYAVNNEVQEHCYQEGYSGTICRLQKTVSSISLKEKILVVAENGPNIQIYSVNFYSYKLIQAITLNKSSQIKTHLEFDEESGEFYLTVWSPSDSYVLIYMCRDFGFSLFKKLEFNNTNINYASVSTKLEMIGISQPNNFLLYNLEGTLIKNFSVSSFVHVFNHQHGNIIMGSSDKLLLYHFCNGKMVYNRQTYKCQEFDDCGGDALVNCCHREFCIFGLNLGNFLLVSIFFALIALAIALSACCVFQCIRCNIFPKLDFVRNKKEREQTRSMVELKDYSRFS